MINRTVPTNERNVTSSSAFCPWKRDYPKDEISINQANILILFSNIDWKTYFII